MNICKKILFLIFFLFIHIHLAEANSVLFYTLEQSATDPNLLTINVDRGAVTPATRLILRGAAFGIKSQVQNLTCEGKPIQEEQTDVWRIPADCRKLSWNIAMPVNNSGLVSAQQSIRSGNFILFSEASSLPRFQNVLTPEVLQISMPHANLIFPQSTPAHQIALPHVAEAPLFILINPTQVSSLSSWPIKLTYLLDNPVNKSKLPDMTEHMKGLEWLNKVIPAKNKLDFTIAWIGEANPKPSLTGATGKKILLVNYPLQGQLPFGNAMPLYVALHEAFHQFASDYPSQPVWVSESLASYYGINALQVALPHDPNAYALLMRFEGDEKKFPEGLLAINRKVLAGDRSEYMAFYTKGIAFWTAVNQALQSRGDDLDHHLLEVLQTQYDSTGNPLNLQKNLNLPDKIWEPIRKRFLDGVNVD